ncbi:MULTISPECIES: mechanosensitive ion channel family protein [unclassified Motilimonas]|uniref:mechanosensitive ion channel family protein n=1 Tax=Motilimonas TaxID=1914248 RepID=UPI001E63ACE5|nr:MULTISPECIES: mechanosensitive ion channel family protein [unclassified Motilimonas]MDO6525802.1 mechanosensitive ion channel family protein [Motilimonas sp. 1_MG-2023]
MRPYLSIAFLLLLLGFSNIGFASSLSEQLEHIAQAQEALKSEQSKLAQSHQEERLYFEDVVQRQNQKLRKDLASIINQYGKSHQDEVAPYIFAQLAFLNQALELTKAELTDSLKLGEQSQGEDKAELTHVSQELFNVIDGHYLALSDTFAWAIQLDLDVAKELHTFKIELDGRAKLLSNMLRFFTKRQADLKARLDSAVESDKAPIQQSLQTLTDNNYWLVNNLENTVNIMDRYQLDTSEYKQLIFSITGAITVDVLDLNVVSGLAQQWLGSLKSWALEHTPTLVMRLLLFGLILVVTRSIARLVKKAVKRSVSHSTMKFSVLMQEFFINLSAKIVYVFGIMVGISQLGVELGPLLAGFGVAGIVIGLALQDTLSNFASGMMILIYRPFDVGDYVEVAGGVRGNVSHMSLVSTTIKTIDHQRLIIPNNKIWGDTINNISAEHFRRVDMLFGIGYGDDIRKAEAVLTEILEAHPAVLKDDAHPYMVKVHALGESSVDFAVRPWVKNEDYWNVYWDVTRSVKLRFDEEKISIPFPQRDVHIYQHNEA